MSLFILDLFWIPSFEGRTPSGEGKTPSGEGNTPSGEEKRPNDASNTAMKKAALKDSQRPQEPKQLQ